MTYLLVGGGEVDILCLNETVKEIENESIFVVAVDRGYNACLAAGIKPDMLLGDFDSLGVVIAGEAKASGIPIIELNPVKDDTDMEAAVRFAASKCKKGKDRIIMTSAMGGRLDHTLGCLALLGLKQELGIEIELRNSFNRACMLFEGEEHSFAKARGFGKFVSFFPVNGSATLTLKGMKYPLDSHTLKGYNTLGVSNEITDISSACARVEKGTVLMVRSRDNIMTGDRLC